MTWKLDEGRPIYGQLVDEIKLRIMTGVYPAGSRMQSVRDLAGEAGVNPNTMQRALAELERQGLMKSRRTSGRFVTEDEERIIMMRRQAAEQITADFLQKMYALGLSRKDILELVHAQGASGRELPAHERKEGDSQ